LASIGYLFELFIKSTNPWSEVGQLSLIEFGRFIWLFFEIYVADIFLEGVLELVSKLLKIILLLNCLSEDVKGLLKIA